MVPLGETHTEKVKVRFWMHFQRRAKRGPTLLELELLDTGLIGGDGGTLDTNTILLDGLSRVNGDLVVGLVTVFKTLGRGQPVLFLTHPGGGSYQVVVLQVDVKVGQDHLQSPDALVNYNYTLQPRGQEAPRLTFSLISFQMMRVIYNADDSGQHMLG